VIAFSDFCTLLDRTPNMRAIALTLFPSRSRSVIFWAGLPSRKLSCPRALLPDNQGRAVKTGGEEVTAIIFLGEFLRQ